MCGIAGIYNYSERDRPVDRDLLVRMTRLLSHRGPDDEGFRIEGPIALGHRRLSIVDLSPTGRQPMCNEDGSCWISYNGEFYNHADFRPRLLAQGHRFRGPSDTETLVHLLEEDGPDALANVAGIFAFAFWDARRACLTLARDPLGVKQVYYHDDGHRIIFASEIKALLLDPAVARDPDPEAINQYLHFHTALFDRTFFRDIRQLRAGEYMQVTRSASRRHVYWSVNDFSRVSAPGPALVEKLRGQLGSVVAEQLMSDVPVGSFFSGGIDSSAIAAHASLSGKRPVCFGVHFSNQGVIDERPYQEAAAKALGLDLRLITLDGSSFPDDLMRLLYFQDEPVIGAAMFPMAYVSQLAAREVKVCLGGQGADEVFGGYARYALARPGHVIASWFRGRRSAAGTGNVSVTGNLGKQMVDRKVLRRLARNARRMMDWEASYFENFAKVPESSWLQVLSARDFCSRQRCRQLFHETVSASPAVDPADKVMHWDMQTYLTGLFHQDDRMSMAASLESRVPMADPRLVRFAFRVGFDAKFRGGASKWLLRQAVSDVLPQMVLTRRKAGFDTPAETWMKGPQFNFVRDLLLSKRARERGFWNAKAIEERLSRTGSPEWFDVFWKVVCIEAWATIFLDKQACDRDEGYAYKVQASADPAALTCATKNSAPATRFSARDRVQEARELGWNGTVARGLWEFKTRTGLIKLKQPYGRAQHNGHGPAPSLLAPAVAPQELSDALNGLISSERLRSVSWLAGQATRGRILCFSRWIGDYGDPIDWHRNPRNGERWSAGSHWSEALRQEARTGDVKLTCEAARFPQAFYMARAATFEPRSAPDLAAALHSQIEGFIAANPAGSGIHWNSGQEIVLRVIAWSFALKVFERLGFAIPERLERNLQEHLQHCAVHLAEYIEYARKSVYNNHLISEALGLCLLGAALPNREQVVAEGLAILDEQATVQFGPDGSYFMNSHSYHRAVVQTYLWAMTCGVIKDAVPVNWKCALENSLDFLLFHQNPADGRLPNFGANDGSLPLPLSTCDFSDFRPTLQAISVATRGERIYEPGPWDEMATWLLGPQVQTAPLRAPERKSASFDLGGFHVLRGRDSANFGCFRCGSLRDRFAQMDMLHLDIWWRGHNVLVDGGSYLYNGPQEWHEHFYRTGSHNTVQVDSCDQMLHVRRFKSLHPTQAKLLHFEDHPDWALCEGEHYGFLRPPANCTHRRSVLFVKDETWIVVDQLIGSGSHTMRLHWLAGDYPFEAEVNGVALRLSTPDGVFSLSTFDELGRQLSGTVVAGGENPPRGWLSRYYAEKIPVASYVAERTGELPLVMVSVLGPGTPRVHVDGMEFNVASGEIATAFRISRDGIEPDSIQLFKPTSVLRSL